MVNVTWVSNEIGQKEETPLVTIKFSRKLVEGKKTSYTLHVNTGLIKTAEKNKWTSMKLGYAFNDKNEPMICVKFYESEVKNSIRLLDKYKKHKKVLGVTAATNHFLNAGLKLEYGKQLQLEYNKQSKLWCANLNK